MATMANGRVSLACYSVCFLISGPLVIAFQIIPPAEWVPRKSGYDNLDITIPAPIVQEVHGCQGLYTQYNIQKKAIHVKDFEKLANGER